MRDIKNFATNKEKIIYAIKNPIYGLGLVLKQIAPHIKNDELYLKLSYYCDFREKLNLNNPQTFNEKLQWLKIHNRRDEFTDMSDKAVAKKIAASYMGDEFIVPTYGVYEHFEDIDFNNLPDQFVLKCTHNSGGTVICRDKSVFNKKEAKKILNRCLSKNPFWTTREYPYKNIKPRIIAEKFLDDGKTKESGLTDYKFFCFNGEVFFLYVSQGLEDHSTAGISFFDLKGNRLPFKRSDFHPIKNFTVPTNFSDMINVVKKTAKQINVPFIRIDLYEVYGHLYFSEFTFFPCSGVLPFEPEEWDKKIGDLLILPKQS